jgi:hypothetical protein
MPCSSPFVGKTACKSSRRSPTAQPGASRARVGTIADSQGGTVQRLRYVYAQRCRATRASSLYNPNPGRARWPRGAFDGQTLQRAAISGLIRATNRSAPAAPRSCRHRSCALTPCAPAPQLSQFREHRQRFAPPSRGDRAAPQFLHGPRGSLAGLVCVI